MTRTVETGVRAVVIIGGGPAGLTAAHELCKAGLRPVVLERGRSVGGLARTEVHKGFRFDIGGHRFYTKSETAAEIWREVLPARDFLKRKRLSRIHYKGRFFHYPLRASSMLFSLGPVEGLLILLSYLRARLFPSESERTFEEWVTNRFGRRLYRAFFKTYTEKVWGIPCGEINADWAAQRIRGLSLAVAVRDIFRRTRAGDDGTVVKTLIDEFDYPRLGPGMMWEAMADSVRERGGEVRLGASVERINMSGRRVESVEIESEGRREILRGTDFISSMPMRELIGKLSPAPPARVVEAAERLRYRDFLTVVLVINRRDLFPDNWIYIHDPAVRLGRVQNFKNWSADMVPDASKTCLGLEYFCFEGDGLWAMRDEELIALGKRELRQLGLARPEEVEDGTVLRVPKAYPVYDSTYRESLEVLRDFFASVPNLQPVGRNGMHRYNNQDHSMLTAVLAVRNILGESHDLWHVNTDAAYHEERADDPNAHALKAVAATQPAVPERIQSPLPAPAVEYE
ncbi:MAG TPA: NAD(P)/FAD-dependent oxidoreductase [Pyrinomonadaceae bacterium]|nr:NAD(P)/FAD-dependent oxidoreductase [Pyrinomonadaceae bacterium]